MQAERRVYFSPSVPRSLSRSLTAFHMTVRRSSRALAWLFAAACASQPVPRPTDAATPIVAPSTTVPAPPDEDYYVFAASEGNDQIALIRFGPSGIRVERTSTTGIMPSDIDGPHGVALSPDGRYYYVTTAHGTPFGFLWKYATANDSLAGRVMLGNFPATAQVTPDGAFVYVVNFNLYGEMLPSSMSIVAADEMVEVARVQTCTMPHGSRVNPQGTKQYSGCMMDDLAVEIDTRDLGISRHFMLAKGKEHGMTGAPRQHAAESGHAAPDPAAHGMNAPMAGEVSCSPTWVQPSADGAKIFVACNKSSEIVEIDVASWTMTRRIPTGNGVYNLAVTRDGRYLVGTNKRDRSVSVIDIASGREAARVPTTRRVASGVTISSDDRYAFVTQEGVGSEPGAVDVIDLRALRKVATVDIGQQAGGIDFWKAAAPR
jgi:DNA-binding beta-propeller fold protein YncE